MNRAARILYVLTLLMSPNLVAAEELLKKNNVEYLGWLNKNDNTKFTTCSGSSIAVGDGKVEKTQDKCKTVIQYPPLLGKVAKLEALSPSISTLHVTDAAGVIHEFNLAATPASLKTVEVAGMVAVTPGTDRVTIAYATANEPNPPPLVFKKAEAVRLKKE